MHKANNKVENEKEQKEKLDRERMDERADILHTIAKSNKHTFNFNGMKIGAENEYPRLGLSDASREED